MVTRRPPFTGIHEIPPKRGDPGIHEGGGDLPPYHEDIFQRVVDVNWTGAGAVFVSGDVCCYVRTASIPVVTLDQEWVPVGKLMFGDGGGHSGCSYANVQGKPTFLMVGTRDGREPSPDGTLLPWGGLVMYSHNGTTWFYSFHYPDNRVNSVVWFRNKFYIELNAGEVFSSVTGRGGWIQEFIYFDSVCPDGIPDGLVGYNPTTDLTIYPADLSSGSFTCNATAFCGGMWVAGGTDYNAGPGMRSITISSIDDGKTWEVVTQGMLNFGFDDPITTIIGGPIADFR